MNPEDELKAQLAKELEELKQATERYRSAELEDRRELFEQPIGLFDHSWQEHLNSQEQAELRGANVAAREAALQSERDTIANRKEIDRQELPVMRRDDQRALWAAERRGDPEMTKELEQKAAEIYEASRQTIQERYIELRQDLENGIQAIEQGREPGLAEVVEKNVEQPAQEVDPRFSLSAYQRLAERDPAAAQAISEPELQRSIEQEHQR